MRQSLPAELSSPSHKLEKALLHPFRLVAVLVASLSLQSLAWQLGKALARTFRKAALTANTPQLSVLWSCTARQIFGAVSGSIHRSVCCLSPSAHQAYWVMRASQKQTEPTQKLLTVHQVQGICTRTLNSQTNDRKVFRKE